MPSALGKLDIVRVCFKNPNSAAGGPFRRNADVGALGQTRDLGGWPGDPGCDSPRLDACKDSHTHSNTTIIYISWSFPRLLGMLLICVVLLASLGKSSVNAYD